MGRVHLRGHLCDSTANSFLVEMASERQAHNVIQGYRFWPQSKAHIGPYLAPFQRYGGLKVKNQHFSYRTPIPAKIWGCSLWSRPVMLGSAESQVPFPKLVIRIFEEFQRV